MDERREKKAAIQFIGEDFAVDELDNRAWQTTQTICIERYWSGADAPRDRHFTAHLLWSNDAFYVRFDAVQNEPLIINDAPDLKKKTVGLWDRDVCEIFIAPDADAPERYFEFEVAPTGEWIDLAIRQLPDKRETDFAYDSQMRTATRIEENKIVSAIKIGWRAFGKKPPTGDVWKGNLFRCVGSGANRGYLAWQPTRTAQPNFHLPSAFGDFEFIK